MHGGSRSTSGRFAAPKGEALPILTGLPDARSRRRTALLGLALLAAGCAGRPALFKPRIALSDLRLEVAREANDNMPLRIELVATGDEELLAKLLELSAAQWFDPRANYRRDYPTSLRSWDYELPPGAVLHLKPAPFAGAKAAGLVLFANYRGKGAYRLRLDPYRRAVVAFGAQDAVLAAASP